MAATPARVSGAELELSDARPRFKLSEGVEEGQAGKLLMRSPHLHIVPARPLCRHKT
jgi:hypothetical protein